jgi:hypothetical protein
MGMACADPLTAYRSACEGKSPAQFSDFFGEKGGEGSKMQVGECCCKVRSAAAKSVPLLQSAIPKADSGPANPAASGEKQTRSLPVTGRIRTRSLPQKCLRVAQWFEKALPDCFFGLSAPASRREIISLDLFSPFAPLRLWARNQA